MRKKKEGRERIPGEGKEEEEGGMRRKNEEEE